MLYWYRMKYIYYGDNYRYPGKEGSIRIGVIEKLELSEIQDGGV